MSATVADLFAGPGGWDLPARDLGLDVEGLDVDADTVATRRANDLRTRQADVRATAPPRARLEGLIGSPPCPTYSAGAGRHGLADWPVIAEVIRELGRGNDLRPVAYRTIVDERSLLVVEPLRWALAAGPRWVALEQVPAVLPIWQATATELERVGYSVAVGVLEAADYGVPQTRRRAVLVARLDRPAELPAPTHDEHGPTLLGEAPWRTMADVNAWAPDDLVGFPRRADTDDVVTLNGVDFRARDLRRADRPAFTLTGKARSWVRLTTAGTGHRVTFAEAARLQTFPVEHRFEGSRSSRFLQAANAVPPAFARAILTAATV